MKSIMEHHLMKSIYPSANMYRPQSARHPLGLLDNRVVTGGQALSHMLCASQLTRSLNHTRPEGAMNSLIYAEKERCNASPKNSPSSLQGPCSSH